MYLKLYLKTIRVENVRRNLNTLVSCTNWSCIDKVQPFRVNISSNAILLLDFHCHLTNSEVVGYLGGSWDFPTQSLSRRSFINFRLSSSGRRHENTRNVFIFCLALTVKNAYPFRSRLHDEERTSLIEKEVRNTFTEKNIVLVGWYHSHPETIATPTLRDIESQLDYEVQIKGPTIESYIPCVGIICCEQTCFVQF